MLLRAARGTTRTEPKPLTFDAPPAELEVIAPVAGEISVGAELDVLWRPPSSAGFAQVVVALDSDSDDRIICFFGASHIARSQPFRLN